MLRLFLAVVTALACFAAEEKKDAVDMAAIEGYDKVAVAGAFNAEYPRGWKSYNLWSQSPKRHLWQLKRPEGLYELEVQYYDAKHPSGLSLRKFIKSKTKGFEGAEKEKAKIWDKTFEYFEGARTHLDGPVANGDRLSGIFDTKASLNYDDPAVERGFLGGGDAWRLQRCDDFGAFKAYRDYMAQDPSKRSHHWAHRDSRMKRILQVCFGDWVVLAMREGEALPKFEAPDADFIDAMKKREKKTGQLARATFREAFYVVEAGDDAFYVLRYSAPDWYYENYRDHFDRLMASFQVR